MKLTGSTALFGSQSGAALLTTLLILALLTLLGMVITSAGLVEMNIAHNTRVHDLAFYQAEAGRQYALGWLADQPVAPTGELGSVMAAASWEQAFTAAAAAEPQIVYNDDHQPQFSVSISFFGSRQPPLFSTDFRRADYAVDARGYGPQSASSRILVNVGRLHSSEGY